MAEVAEMRSAIMDTIDYRTAIIRICANRSGLRVRELPDSSYVTRQMPEHCYRVVTWVEAVSDRPQDGLEVETGTCQVKARVMRKSQFDFSTIDGTEDSGMSIDCSLKFSEEYPPEIFVTKCIIGESVEDVSRKLLHHVKNDKKDW